MRKTNIEGVTISSIFFHGVDKKIPGFDRVIIPNRYITKILVKYDDEKKPVEVFSREYDNDTEIWDEIRDFMTENGLNHYPTDRPGISFTYLDANKYIERKSHDKMWRENCDLKETIEGLENKIRELEDKNDAMRKKLRLDEPIMRYFKFKGDKKT